MKVGIIGYGFLGKAFEYALQTKNEIMINDILYTEDNGRFCSKRAMVRKCEIILVGVPTPYSERSGYCPDILDSVISELNELAGRIGVKPVICIKSAVLPSHVTRLIADNVNLDIVISPEYLSGRDSIRDMINCPVLIVGGSVEGCDKVIELFRDHSVICKDLKIGRCTAQEAALIKYMENSFLAMKCYWLSEFCEYYELMQGNSSGYNEVIRLFQYDDRVGSYPYKIPYEGSLGYCSGCLEKDVPAIVAESYKQGTELELMAFVHHLNELKYRKGYHPYCSTRPNEVIRDGDKIIINHIEKNVWSDDPSSPSIKMYIDSDGNGIHVSDLALEQKDA